MADKDNPADTDLRVVAFMRAKPGQERAVREAILACVAPSRQEDGNLSYVAHVDSKDSALFVVVEHWADAAARASFAVGAFQSTRTRGGRPAQAQRTRLPCA